jgi:hypothetical protein
LAVVPKAFICKEVVNLQFPRFERVEIVPRPLFCHRPVKGRHIATTIHVAPFDKPMDAAVAVGMDEDFTRPLVVGGAIWIVETLALSPHTLNSSSTERISEIGGLHFLERPISRCSLPLQD